ncbi:MAG: hypothetical protein SV201_05700 [Pseudomonadota bacterium]|nr:hypothetical protein [Pseudomonadota bacterium]
MEEDVIKKAVHAALDERDSLDRTTHQDHHRWVAKKKAREEAWVRRWDRVSTSVIVGIIMLMVTGTVAFIKWVGTQIGKGLGH